MCIARSLLLQIDFPALVRLPIDSYSHPIFPEVSRNLLWKQVDQWLWAPQGAFLAEPSCGQLVCPPSKDIFPHRGEICIPECRSISGSEDGCTTFGDSHSPASLRQSECCAPAEPARKHPLLGRHGVRPKPTCP